MTKGTPAMGKKQRKGRMHIRCARCGSPSFHKIKKRCARCGYGARATMRHWSWLKKHRRKKAGK